MLALLIYVLQGVAFGLLFLNTPVAIVTVLVLPTVWTIATQVISSLEDVGRWINLDSVTAPLFAGEMAGQDWAQLGTGVARVGAAAPGGRHLAGAPREVK